jgi:hypothetical protein
MKKVLKMSNRNKLIIALLVVGIALLSIFRFYIIPEKTRNRLNFKKNQNDSLTHNISSVKQYKSKYVGDSRVIGQKVCLKMLISVDISTLNGCQS